MSGLDEHFSWAATPGSTQVHSEHLADDAALAAIPTAEGDDAFARLAQAAKRRYGFRIGAFNFLVQANVHSEVVRSPAIAAIPLSPPPLLGLMNLRSNLVPVFDLHNLCHLPGPAQALATVLVLDVGEKAVGLPIDGLPVRLGTLNPVAQLPPLPEALRESVHTGYLAGDEVWLEFDHDHVFSFVTGTP